MKITLLGTGTSQGIPVIGCSCKTCTSTNPKDKRFRCSVLLETESGTVLIDIGPDVRQQLLASDVKKLDAIVLTHEHMDHLAGLDEIRPFNYQQKKAIKVYATLRVQERLKEQYSYIFNSPNYPGIPSIELITINSEETFTAAGISFIPIEVMHGNLPVLGFRINDFTYITDANFISPKEKAKMEASKIIVINALRKEKHHSHFSLSEAIKIIEELNPEKSFLTHISHHLEPHDELENCLPAKVNIAFDGLTLF